MPLILFKKYILPSNSAKNRRILQVGLFVRASQAMLTGRRWTMVERIVSKMVRELIVNEIIDVSQKEEYEYALIC